MTEADLKKIWLELNKANTQIDANTIAIQELLRSLSKESRDPTPEVTDALERFAAILGPDPDLGGAEVRHVIRTLKDRA